MTADRSRRLDPAQLDAEQRQLYDVITGGPRAQGPQAFALTDSAGGLTGPFNAMLLQPALGHALQSLGSAIRYSGRLSDREREIAILVVAMHWDSSFELHTHTAIARSIGLTAVELATLADPLATLADPREQLVAATVARLVRSGDLDDEDYAAAASLGADILFELTTVVGYYATLAMQLRVFRVQAPTVGEAS